MKIQITTNNEKDRAAFEQVNQILARRNIHVLTVEVNDQEFDFFSTGGELKVMADMQAISVHPSSTNSVLLSYKK